MEYPKGMNVNIPEEKECFTQLTKQNLKLKDINYVKMILEQLEEIESFYIDIKNSSILESEEGSFVTINLQVFKKEGT